MTVDNMLESLPPFIDVPFGHPMKLERLGLQLRYKVSIDKWVCGYGRNDKHAMSGNTPYEAVDLFIEAIKNSHK
jgi:hypothetical protein